MPLYEGTALFSVMYTAQADNSLDAADFMAEMAREEFPDIELDNIKNIKEVKVN